LYGIGEERLLKAKAKAGGSASSSSENDEQNYLIEYQAVGLHWAEFIWTFRLSMGDFALIEAIKGLPKSEGNIFWFLWIIGLIITCVVFLNFIVAEASASYATVIKKLHKITW
jgi:hypothetical protein